MSLCCRMPARHVQAEAQSQELQNNDNNMFLELRNRDWKGGT